MADSTPRRFNVAARENRRAFRRGGLLTPKSAPAAAIATMVCWKSACKARSRDDLFLLEVAAYPERRLGNQLTRDLMLVYLDRGEWPEAVTLVLRPKGKYRVPSRLAFCVADAACRRAV